MCFISGTLCMPLKPLSNSHKCQTAYLHIKSTYVLNLQYCAYASAKIVQDIAVHITSETNITQPLQCKLQPADIKSQWKESHNQQTDFDLSQQQWSLMKCLSDCTRSLWWPQKELHTDLCSYGETKLYRQLCQLMKQKLNGGMSHCHSIMKLSFGWSTVAHKKNVHVLYLVQHVQFVYYVILNNLKLWTPTTKT